jgi:hypothetical protein
VRRLALTLLIARESLRPQPNDALLEVWRADGLDEELADGRGLQFDSRLAPAVKPLEPFVQSVRLRCARA